MNELGLKNSIWRTPGSDVGRDIQGDYYLTDLSGYFQQQKWYIECKRYSGSIDWPTIWKKIAYAEAHDSDILLFATTSFLSPQASDQVNEWNSKSKRPLVRFWTISDVKIRLDNLPWIAQKYGLVERPEEISARILLPANNLLVKLANSLGTDKELIRIEKIELIQSLSELIAIRLDDLIHHGKYKFVPLIQKYHFLEWMEDNNKYLSIFDVSSIRTFLSYLRMVFSGKNIEFTLNKEVLKIKTPKPFTGAISEHLKIISGLSNFSICITNDRVELTKI
jgi:hypothetical protein